MGKQVKVLLVGAAFSADLHMDGYSRCRDLAKIVAICDKDLGRVEALANRYGVSDYTAYDDYKKAIDEVDCDLVDICLPNFLHHDVAIYAFSKGDMLFRRNRLQHRLTCQDMVDAAMRQERNSIMPKIGNGSGHE